MDEFFFPLPSRKTKRVDFKRAVEIFINSNYDLGMYNAHRDAINELDALRRACVECDITKNIDGISYLATYLMQLFDLAPKLSDANYKFKCEFMWYNSVERGSLNLKPIKHVNENISFEVANVFMMFVATIWQKACQRNIFGNNDELKQAKNEFLLLSGMCHFLLEFVKSNELDDTLSDLSPPFIATLNLLALTHAQECLFIKAYLDKMTDLLMAKITKQLFIHYGTCRGLIKNYKSSSTFIKDLCKYFDSKQNFYKSLFNNFQGCEDLTNRKYNDYLARMKNSFDGLNLSDMSKRAGNIPLIRNLDQKIRTDYNTAMEDNRCIYNSIPTPSESLSEVEPTSIVKTPPFVPDMLQQFIAHEKYTDLFQFLHSIAMNKLITHFINTRESFVANKLSIVEEADKQLDAKLIEFNLPACIESCAANELPPSIKTKSDEFTRYGGMNTILEHARTIKEIRRLYKDVVQCIKKSLDEEKAHDDAFRVSVPECQQISPSKVASATYVENYNYIVDKIEQAGEADSILESNLDQLKARCHILSNPTTSALQGKFGFQSFDSKSMTPAEQNELHRLYNLLLTTREERDKIILIYCSREDRSDLLYKMMKERPKEDSSLWPNEIINKDYAEPTSQLEDNIKTQASILRQLDSYINSIGLKTRLHSKDQILCQEVCQIYNVFLDVSRHINQGMSFHDQINDLALKLQDQVNDFVKSRNIEKSMFLEQKAANVANKQTYDTSFNRSFNSSYDTNPHNSSSGSLNSSFYGSSALPTSNLPPRANEYAGGVNTSRCNPNYSFDTSTTISSQYPSNYSGSYHQQPTYSHAYGPPSQMGTNNHTQQHHQSQHQPVMGYPPKSGSTTAGSVSSYYSRSTAVSRYPPANYPHQAYGTRPKDYAPASAAQSLPNVAPISTTSNNAVAQPSHPGASPYTHLPAYGHNQSSNPLYPPSNTSVYSSQPFSYTRPSPAQMNTNSAYPYNTPRPMPSNPIHFNQPYLHPSTNAPRADGRPYYPNNQSYDSKSHYIPPRY